MRIIYIIFLFMNYSYIGANYATTPVSQLPETFGTYQITDRLDYTGEDLFDYINGGAEMYLSYGLVGMKGCKYNAEGLPQVTVEVYEMTESKNAFGVFTQSRDKEERDYGQGSQSFNDAILFWKDRYFVVINTHKATPESKEAIAHFASVIDQSIPEEGEMPSIINRIPQNDLLAGGYLYFHHYIWLNAYFFIANYNIIDIEEHTDAILAKFGTPESRSYLLIVEYPEDEAVHKALVQLSEKFAPETSLESVIQLEDNKWFKAWKKGNKLGAIFNAPDKNYLEKLYQETFNKM